MNTAGDFNRETGGFTALFRDLLKELRGKGSPSTASTSATTPPSGTPQEIDWRLAAGKIGGTSPPSPTRVDRAMGAAATARRQVLGVLAAETGAGC
jgi:hypothetical protein